MMKRVVFERGIARSSHGFRIERRCIIVSTVRSFSDTLFRFLGLSIGLVVLETTL